MPKIKDPNQSNATPNKKSTQNRVTGYRVEVFKGGNTSKDRKEAEKIASEIRSKTHEPVYVNFYNPNWICRVGDYRTYEEAQTSKENLLRLGFTHAIVMKGKINRE